MREQLCGYCAAGLLGLLAMAFCMPALGAGDDAEDAPAVFRTGELIDRYEALGRGPSALEFLRQELVGRGNRQRGREAAQALAALSSEYRGRGVYADAKRFIDAAVELAEKTAPSESRAAYLNEQAVLLAAAGRHLEADHAFRQSLALLAPGATQRVPVQINRLRNYVDAREVSGLDGAGFDFPALTTGLAPPLQLRYAKVLIDLAAMDDPRGVEALGAVATALRARARQADVADVEHSYVWGYLGRIAELRGDHEGAMAHSRRALLLAQGNPTSVYRWEWQLARLLRARGSPDAPQVYEQAIASLDSVRAELAAGTFRGFEQVVAPLYMDYVDYLLGRAHAEPAAAGPLRRKVLGLIESARRAEVEDYFKDQCLVVEVETALSEVARDAAVIYPIVLADRLELLVYAAGGMHQFTVPVGRAELDETVGDYRRALEFPEAPGESPGYLSTGQQLYQWLVQPLEHATLLDDVTHLVFVPAGALRTVPLAALHDGEGFLVQRFATAVSPGLTLIEPRGFESVAPRVLLAGISEAVQGFQELPSVNRELAAIGQLFPGQTMINETFLLASLSDELAGGDYSIVHLATHGMFRGLEGDSFVLAYDGRFTMDRLEATVGLRRFTDDPLELLVLSACQTALGDERAALGLAGVAIQSGARSALASLWIISDTATYELMSDFYGSLATAEVDKALALRSAQLRLLESSRFAHPYYWSGLLLIGNWL